MGRYDRTLAERLEEKIERRGPDECWPWTAGTDAYGYGRIRVKGRCALAHREVYRLEKGEPEGVVRHSCDNPPCCNPAHLLDGTQAENVADAIAAGSHVSRRKHLITGRPKAVLA